MENKADVIAKPNIRLPRPTGPYVFNVKLDYGQQDVASFFRSWLIASEAALDLRRTPY